LERRRRARCAGQRDERIHEVRVALGHDPVRGSGEPTRRVYGHDRMLSAPERFEAKRLGCSRHGRDVHAVRWERHRETDVHGVLLLRKGLTVSDAAIIGEPPDRCKQGRTNMPHGIAEVRAHLAKLPARTTNAERRAMYDRAEQVFTVPPGTTVESVTAGGRPAEWIRPAGARHDAVLLYLHGGGYVIGSPRSHRHLAEAIARAAGISCLLPDYRLAPQPPFPAAVGDSPPPPPTPLPPRPNPP